MHVVECFGGGVLQSIAKLCHFMKDDADLVVVHSKREQTPDKFTQFYPENTLFIPWASCRSINLIQDFKSALQLRQVVKDQRPDVLHLHSSKAGAIGRLAFPFGKRGMKIIYTPRAYAFLQLDMHPLKRFIYWAVEKFLGVFPHTTVACGKGEYTLATKIARKSDIVLNSISINYIDSLVQKTPKNKVFTVVSSGRICPQKNFPMFVDVARYFEGADVQFVWIGGEIPPEMHIPSNLTVTGWMPYETSIKEMAKADVYFQPSLWEGLSLTVLESMAMGLPIVLSNAVGNREMVNHGVDGYICHLKEEYIEAISKLKESEDLRQSFGAAARTKILEEYNHEKTLSDWKRVYVR